MLLSQQGGPLLSVAEGRGMQDGVWTAGPGAAALLALEEQTCLRGSGEAEGDGVSGNTSLAHQPVRCYWFLLKMLPLSAPSGRDWGKQVR